jgi:predicted  nucleic acid-binding Zn-ribbon protein
MSSSDKPIKQTIIGVRNSQTQDSLIKPIAPALKLQHNQEKEELSKLNDRLANSIERLRFLEGSNQKILNEVDALKNSWGSDSRSIIEKYEPELLKTLHKVDELGRDSAKAAIRSKRINYEIENIKRNLDQEQNIADEDRRKMKNLENVLEQNMNELDSLLNRIKDKESDLKKNVKENENLNDDLSTLLNELDDELFISSQLRNENQTLEEHIPFLKAIHEQEVAEMKYLSNVTNVNPAQFYRSELDRAIRDIRNDFEQLNDLEKRELDAWYKIKAEEIKLLSAKREGVDELPNILETNKNLKDQINKNNDEIKDLNKHHKDLVDKLNRLQDALEELKRNNVDELDKRDREIAELKRKIEDLLDDIDRLLHNKTLPEINTFRRLLESNGPRDDTPPSNQITSDELLQRLEREHAKNGDMRVSLAWDNVNDLDLHVIEPSGQEISFSRKKSSSGGAFDIDLNVGSQRNHKPIENIYWPKGSAPRGHYKVMVVHYSNHGGSDPTDYLVLAEFYGKRLEFRGKMSYGDQPDVYDFDV